jgi:Na+/H+ antiporter NhaC
MKTSKTRLTVRQLTVAAFAVLLFIGLACVAAYGSEAEGAEHVSNMFGTFWSLLPPVIAIALALITKEVYSSLAVGIIAGALFYSNFNVEMTLTSMFAEGFIASLSDSWNVGILIFLVILGAFVVLINKSGGSAAYGDWAIKRIKTRKGAQAATVALGILIFIDDYFNCLTVGNVMRPVADKHRISRAKLAYIVDATAAPVCMIAPISSWAAAVSGFTEGNGIELFVRAIPFNFYSLLTILTLFLIIFWKIEFGPMRKHEINAIKNGDLHSTDDRPEADESEKVTSTRGRVMDLVLPVLALIAACVIGMVYTGGFFDGTGFVDAFSNSDASLGLALGSFVAFLIAVIYFICRRTLSFTECMGSLVSGFKAMVPAILILTFAWTLNTMTGLLGAPEFVSQAIEGGASFMPFMPAVVFLIAVGLSFATGTSWGTFGILIPIVMEILPSGDPLQIITMSACLAGAVCGDHCSPISDTTIMSSAGAQSNHINHVSTQLPYALMVAGVSFVSYIIAGFVKNVFVALPIALVLMVGTLYVIKMFNKPIEAGN